MRHANSPIPCCQISNGSPFGSSPRSSIDHTPRAPLEDGENRAEAYDRGIRRADGAIAGLIQYLKSPPTRLLLRQLVDRMGVPVRAILRTKGSLYAELGLADPSLSDDQLLDAMMEHPILIERPIVVTPKGVRLCRPSETVLDLLPPQLGEFRKEDGELAVDAKGRPAATA